MRDKETNIFNVAKHYLTILKVPFTNSYLKKLILHDPYFPQLTALSNVFKKYKIETKAYQVPEDKFSLLTPPYVAYVDDQPAGKDLILVTASDGTNVTYISSTSTPVIVSKDGLLESWEGVVIVATSTAGSKEPAYDKHLGEESSRTISRTLAIAGIALLIVAGVYGYVSSVATDYLPKSLLILLFKSMGLAVAILLFIYQLDTNNSFIKKICTSGEKTSCDSILQGKASKIFGISWSDIGFVYFSASLILLVCTNIDFATKMALVAVGNLFAAPYIFFSIYYQWKVAKQWCRLCLMVQAVLALELIWAVIFFWTDPYFSWSMITENVIGITASLLTPIIALYFLKAHLIKAKTADKFEAAYKRLIYHPEAFKASLENQDDAPDDFEQIALSIGKAGAKRTIIKVDNPYCLPCAKAHEVLHQILETNEDVNLKIIFRVKSMKSQKNDVAKHFIALSETLPPGKFAEALDDWYLSDKKDYKTFASKYPIASDLNQYNNRLEAMRKWCKKADIESTPTFFIDGKLLPQQYSTHDLPFLV